MKKIVIMSVHPSFDYRIERHIKSLLILGYMVYYLNITNEKSINMNIKHDNFLYMSFFIETKNLFNVLKICFGILVKLKQNSYDYIFVQDPIILSLLIFKFDKSKIVLDYHEIIQKESFLNKLLIKIMYRKINKNVITALKQSELNKYNKNVILFENFPLLSDFDNFNKCNFVKSNVNTIIYTGMITEQNRQMIKTLNIFKLLLKEGFKVILIGKIANTINKEKIIDTINQLEEFFPESFTYYGTKSHDFVIQKIIQSDFSINLVDYEDEVVISPNKCYDYLLGETIQIINHCNFKTNLPGESCLYINKTSSEEEIKNKILDYCKTYNLAENKKRGREFITNNKLYWETYLSFYKNIFE